VTALLAAPWAEVRFRAIGTDVHVLVTEPALRDEAEAVTRAELDALDRACSRFRDDSELVRLRGRTRVSPLLAEAVRAALEVAEDTDGLVVPTLGRALRAAGYDRTFTQLPQDGPAAVVLPVAPQAWRDIRVEGDLVTLPPGVELDLGATAKAWAADRVAQRLLALGTGALVNLGGDLSVAGPVPPGGWTVEVTDRPVDGTLVQRVAVHEGGLATSSTTARRWQRGGVALHHVLDPATGRPAPETWASVTVGAPTCLEANAASTAAVVLGPDAPAWLQDRGLPAVLLAATGEVVRVNGWPEEDGR
jgi:thiamine biosynthesis lipoprotein